MPFAAKPAAKVTACSSAIPTSKNLSGYLSPNFFKPVPSGIAAVIATIFLFSLPNSNILSENISVYVFTLLSLIFSPVLTSNESIPWNLVGLFSAGK